MITTSYTDNCKIAIEVRIWSYLADSLRAGWKPSPAMISERENHLLHKQAEEMRYTTINSGWLFIIYKGRWYVSNWDVVDTNQANLHRNELWIKLDETLGWQSWQFLLPLLCSPTYLINNLCTYISDLLFTSHSYNIPQDRSIQLMTVIIWMPELQCKAKPNLPIS